MDDAGHRLMRVVADRVGALFRARLDLFRAGDELSGDRVGGIAGVDQLGHVGGHRDGVARRDPLQGREGLCVH